MANNDSNHLLRELKNIANAMGRTPIKSEFSQWRELKRCFGSWEKAVRAAGLDSANSPKQHYLRAEHRRESLIIFDIKADDATDEIADPTTETEQSENE